ncbi:MAG: efflux RND transporter periplasmic adaptor subunit [Gammaproteobacteria bacterium]
MQLKSTILLLCIQIIVSYSTQIRSEEKWAVAKPATNNVAITGFTRAHATIPVTAEVPGKVKEIYADVGDSIPNEGKLACLDDIFVRIDIQTADNEIAQHANDINFFKKEVERQEKLVDKQVSAVNVLDRLNRDLINSQRAMQGVRIRKQRLNELKRRHCIEAPPGWQLIDRLIEPEQWIREGEIVAHIGDYSKLTVPITVTEQELKALKTNTIELLLTEYKINVPAVIEHISPSFDEKTRKIPIDLMLQTGLPEYRGGIRVELAIELPGEENTFSVSRNALEQRFEEYWLQRKNGEYIRVNLLGGQKDGMVKIKSAEIKKDDQFKIIKK